DQAAGTATEVAAAEDPNRGNSSLIFE
ncbi:hypothetical protein A2U01_0102308, partial [Trifolium medium]|nr:hypothetical protein [Trifolium medium]